mmetsp:Transcript_40342/g.91036  ORF Transcript_40342/g.91036 Transcript_40342/m.91036 type:complete len:210 (-) Transcript_40342:339-968(-)
MASAMLQNFSAPPGTIMRSAICFISSEASGFSCSCLARTRSSVAWISDACAVTFSFNFSALITPVSMPALFPAAFLFRKPLLPPWPREAAALSALFARKAFLPPAPGLVLIFCVASLIFFKPASALSTSMLTPGLAPDWEPGFAAWPSFCKSASFFSPSKLMPGLPPGLPPDGFSTWLSFARSANFLISFSWPLVDAAVAATVANFLIS